MSEKMKNPQGQVSEPAKALPEAAKRALAEAEERRAAIQAQEKDEVERNGPKGPEPTRFGDWERKGIAYDF